MPYLKRMCDGKLVATYFRKIAPQSREPAWLFDWSLPVKSGETILELMADGISQGRIAFHAEADNLCYYVDILETAKQNNTYIHGHKAYDGVGAHLFAEVARRSFAAGFDGYVAFIAKTNIIGYYEHQLGAKRIGGQLMYIDTDAARRLVHRYYGDD